MRLYSGSTQQFVYETAKDTMVGKLVAEFRTEYRYSPGTSEVKSWHHSLKAASEVFQEAGLHDHGVIVEYQLPLTSKRIDCIVTGKASDDTDQAVIIELKQWDRCEGGYGDKVMTFVGGTTRDVLHPSVQVGQYRMYLEDTHAAFHEGDSPIHLSGCAFLHNYPPHPSDSLFDERFTPYLKANPVYTAKDKAKLTQFLAATLANGQGQPIAKKIEQSSFRPSKKLLEHVGGLLEGRPEYILLDEQLLAFERVLESARQALKGTQECIVLVRGGPGTGKSVIALNLLAQLSRDGLATHYATGSRAFTTTLKEVVGRRASALCKNFSSYMTAEAKSVDVMICDEAHRMWIQSQNRFVPRDRRSGKVQIAELVDASKVTVFFIDDKQPVRPNEIGSSEYVLNFATQRGCPLTDYTLQAQFRCQGSDVFIRWVTDVLAIENTNEPPWNLKQPFDFKTVNTVDELDQLISAKREKGFNARLTAGFCWEWSEPNQDGSLVEDVRVGAFRRPWNAKPEARHLAENIPPASLWAYHPNGHRQVGCIYTAQGFEFDYVGVIVGPDLVYRKGKGWQGDASKSHDSVVKRGGDRFTDLVKNTYRVLLTRGMRGCYVYCMDDETRDYLISHTQP